MQTTKSKNKVLLPSAMMAVVGLLLGAAVGPAPMTGALDMFQDLASSSDVLRVPAGETHTAVGAVRAEVLHVEGTLAGSPGADLIIHAEKVILGPAAVLRAADGQPGAAALARDAQAEDGTDGRHVVIHADSLVVAAGAVVRAGDGGGGGDAIGRANATAGDGGDGGDIHLHVGSVSGGAFLWPGSGGHGGDARAVAVGDVPTDAAVTGGDGGRSGIAFRNGALTHGIAEAQAVSSSILAGRMTADDLCPLLVGLLPDGDDCSELALPVLSSAAATTLSLPCDPQTVTCDADDVPGQLKELLWAIGRGELPAGGCNTKQGAPGHSGGLDGGDGGDACQAVHGAKGSQGGKGSDGKGNCGAGGAGGLGGQGAGTSATGGLGGNGYRHGGDGGFATSSGTGGPGGDGGRGGINSWGANCAGGPGGTGGQGIGGKATGGSGGEGLCGNGGAGGAADSPGRGGAGGAGGSGNPAGAGGPAGSGSAGPATAGRGGDGLGVCPLQAN